MSASGFAIPEELLRQLHDANEHFRHSRQEVERAMEGSEFRHQERLTNAGDKLREAEREVQTAEERIKKHFADANRAANNQPH